MAPPLLQLKDIALTFGGTPLLTGAELSVSTGERVSLVGRNGSGKSTLLKIAAGLIEPDRGSVFVQPGALVRYLPQEPDFSGFDTTLAYVEAGLPPGGDAHAARTLLSELGLSGAEDVRHLSGGEARRASLARVLAPSPDILLLDEPTNHLDLTTIEWLERALDGRRTALVIISHDRRFLSNLSRQTVWLDRGETRRIERGFAHFEEWRDALLAEEEREQHKLARKIVAEEHWMRYGVTARRKRNMRRVGALQALRERRRSYRAAAGAASITAGAAPASGVLVIEADRIAKSYGARAVVRDFSIRIQRGDRIGIVGPNGSGKTTLINMLIGALAPDSGAVRLGANLAIAALDQHRDSLDPEVSVADALTGGGGDTVMVNGVAQARRRLHEGFSVCQRAGAHAARQAFRRRARPADAGAGARQAVQPAGARRADQRSRHGDAGRARGHAGRLSRHGAADQPRPRFSRPAGERRDRAGRRRPLDRICRRLFRHADAARRRSQPDAAQAGTAQSRQEARASRPHSRRGGASVSRTSTRSKRCRKTIAALQAEAAGPAGQARRSRLLRARPCRFRKARPRRSRAVQHKIAAAEQQWLELEILREELAGQ